MFDGTGKIVSLLKFPFTSVITLSSACNFPFTSSAMAAGQSQRFNRLLSNGVMMVSKVIARSAIGFPDISPHRMTYDKTTQNSNIYREVMKGLRMLFVPV